MEHRMLKVILGGTTHIFQNIKQSEISVSKCFPIDNCFSIDNCFPIEKYFHAEIKTVESLFDFISNYEPNGKTEYILIGSLLLPNDLIERVHITFQRDSNVGMLCLRRNKKRFDDDDVKNIKFMNRILDSNCFRSTDFPLLIRSSLLERIRDFIKFYPKEQISFSSSLITKPFEWIAILVQFMFYKVIDETQLWTEKQLVLISNSDICEPFTIRFASIDELMRNCNWWDFTSVTIIQDDFFMTQDVSSIGQLLEPFFNSNNNREDIIDIQNGSIIIFSQAAIFDFTNCLHKTKSKNTIENYSTWQTPNLSVKNVNTDKIIKKDTLLKSVFLNDNFNSKFYESQTRTKFDTEKDAIVHFLTTGICDHKRYSYGKIPSTFDVAYYIQHNLDVKDFQNDQAIDHWLVKGYVECRAYNASSKPVKAANGDFKDKWTKQMKEFVFDKVKSQFN